VKAKRLGFIKWMGGKGNMLRRILDEMPPHKYYVEPFGGAAHVLLNKSPALVETYNDIDGKLVNLFRVISAGDIAVVQEFIDRVKNIPYSRTLYYEFKEYILTHEPKKPLDIDHAIKFYVCARMSFGGLFGRSFGKSVTTSQRGMASTTSAWENARNLLWPIHDRLQRVQIECQDFREILTRYNTPDYLAYCDPPYAPDTRTMNGASYSNELSNEDHEALVRLLLDYEGMVVLSGYDTPLYRPLEEAGWKKTTYETVCYARKIERGEGKRQKRVECIWKNPAAIAAKEQTLL